jgi:Ni,Fe-hydrogenase maturation factor
MTTRGWAQQKEKATAESEPEEGILAYIKQKNLKNLHYYKQVYAHDPSMQNLIFCTCKKSHCQKKYCLCFEKGVKCGQYCVCLECENQGNEYVEDEAQEERRWERYATYKP